MTREPVVLVHGLWMNGSEMASLRRRLRLEHGFDVHVFSYPTLRDHAADISGRLADFADRVSVGHRVHFVGHSLGGTFVYRALSGNAARFKGNAVLLGSPLSSCRAAQGVMRWRALRPLIGPHLLREVTSHEERCWKGPGALGTIAGTRRVGMGRFFARFDEPNDGTVASSETVIPGLDDHIELRRSHMGMLVAKDVAAQVAHFLRHAKFDREGRKPIAVA
ncbi:MAG: alpha/beta fold hydrolase [Steroidobacteraceae bacterium]|nr:alpha/beta fold hydrolase [Steroidobacteraceae bacterium]